MPGHEHLHDAIDLIRVRAGGVFDAEAELLEARGFDNEVCQRQLLFAQTRLATMLARTLAVQEGRTVEAVLDSLAVAVLQVETEFGETVSRDDWSG
jgi:flagella basal body P-ring formation protein FlgA